MHKTLKLCAARSAGGTEFGIWFFNDVEALREIFTKEILQCGEHSAHAASETLALCSQWGNCSQTSPQIVWLERPTRLYNTCVLKACQEKRAVFGIENGIQQPSPIHIVRKVFCFVKRQVVKVLVKDLRLEFVQLALEPDPALRFQLHYL